MAVRVIEWFAGIGGCAFAIQGRGQIVAAIDIDRDAMAVYRANFPYPTLVREIQSLRLQMVQSWQADLWWMSPPCQPYTARGKQLDDEDRRAESLKVLIQWLEIVRPRWVALENVPPFGQSRMWSRLCQSLANAGYFWATTVLCPTQFGVPNRRRRFYLLASRDTPIEWNPIPCQPHILAEYLLPPDDDDLWVPESLLARYGHAIHVLEDPWSPQSIVSCFTASYGRSPVRSGSCLKTPFGVRRFSPREVARLLGFADGYYLPDSIPRRRLWNLLGNSLSIPVVQWLLSHVVLP